MGSVSYASQLARLLSFSLRERTMIHGRCSPSVRPRALYFAEQRWCLASRLQAAPPAAAPARPVTCLLLARLESAALQPVPSRLARLVPAAPPAPAWSAFFFYR